MNENTGEIRKFSDAEMKSIEERRYYGDKTAPRNPWIPITDAQAAFFMTKGVAFRQLWAKKLRRGLYRHEKEHLDAMVFEFERTRQ